MNLFQFGDFTLRSGTKSKWKLECDALTPNDWEGLAQIASELLPPFALTLGVPRGGIPFAQALNKFATGSIEHPVLICEDVVTTGGSIERYRDQLTTQTNKAGGDKYIGVTVFARGKCPSWITPLFQMPMFPYQPEVKPNEPPMLGDESNCRRCGKPIHFNGVTWTHSETSPRHLALPGVT